MDIDNRRELIFLCLLKLMKESSLIPAAEMWNKKYILFLRNYIAEDYITLSMDLVELILFSKKYPDHPIKYYLQSVPSLENIKKIKINQIAPAAYTLHRFITEVFYENYKILLNVGNLYCGFTVNFKKNNIIEFKKENITLYFKVELNKQEFLRLLNAKNGKNIYNFDFEVKNDSVLRNILNNCTEYHSLNNELLEILNH